MMPKIWKNHWVCDPAFVNLDPLELFHKEYDENFVMPFHKEELKNIHTLFRQKFTVPCDFQKAFLDISADDYYKLYINGQFVTQGPANFYYFRYRYQHMDITEYLQEGENIIAVNVYYHGPVTRAYSSGDYRQGLQELKSIVL